MTRCLAQPDLFTLSIVPGLTSGATPAAAYPQMALADSFRATRSYALIGLQLSTLGRSTGSTGPMGVAVVVGQGARILSLSSSVRTLIVHQGFVDVFFLENWVPFEENAVVITANMSVGLYAFADTTFFLNSTCNLYMMPV